MDNPYPQVSILTPTYNRKKFLPLMLNNIENFDYPKEKIEWCILDDGSEKLFNSKMEELVKNKIHPIKLNYKYLTTKRQIGIKRNMIVKQAKNKIVIMMDDDDIYLPSYLKHSVDELKKNKIGFVGSKDMQILFPHHNYNVSKFQGKSKRQIHEATMCFTKKYFNSMPGFRKNVGHAEGTQMIDYNEKNVGETDIEQCMICVVHSENTYNKERFTHKQFHFQHSYNLEPCIKILSKILKIKYNPFGIQW